MKAIESFEILRNWQKPHLGLVDMNWGFWGSYYPAWANSQRYAHLAPQITEATAYSGDWLSAWSGKSADEQDEDILQRLIAIVAKSLKMPTEKSAQKAVYPR